MKQQIEKNKLKMRLEISKKNQSKLRVFKCVIEQPEDSQVPQTTGVSTEEYFKKKRPHRINKQNSSSKLNIADELKESQISSVDKPSKVEQSINSVLSPKDSQHRQMLFSSKFNSLDEVISSLREV